MEAINLYMEYKRELRFAFANAVIKDYIRGGFLALLAVLLVGLPTFIGYLVFMLQGQSKGADFLPPIEAEMIGDYTYIGFKYLLFIVGYTVTVSAVLWGFIQAPFQQSIQAVCVIGTIFLSLYLFPSTTYLFAKTDIPLPTSTTATRNWVVSMISYEYMTLILLTLLVSLLAALLIAVTAMFIITLPAAFIIIWYLGVSYTRLVGHALSDLSMADA